jgi:hypothetical protein
LIWKLILKLFKIDVKKCSQNDVKMGRYKLIKNMAKNWSKMTPYNLMKKWAKNWFSRGGSTGVKIVKNRPRGTGTPKTEFFEILHFFAKTLHFWPPKIDPINWHYKNRIPHKNACTFRPMGVKKCHFLGGRRADRSDRKM